MTEAGCGRQRGQLLLFTLLVLCGGWQLQVAGWGCGIPSGHESSSFTTMIMLMY